MNYSLSHEFQYTADLATSVAICRTERQVTDAMDGKIPRILKLYIGSCIGIADNGISLICRNDILHDSYHGFFTATQGRPLYQFANTSGKDWLLRGRIFFDAATREVVLVQNNESYMLQAPANDSVGKVSGDGSVVVTNNDGTKTTGTIGDHGIIRDTQGNVVGYVAPGTAVTDYNGKVIGTVNEKGEVIDANGNIIGRVTNGGVVININGAPIGNIAKPAGVVRKDPEVITATGDGKSDVAPVNDHSKGGGTNGTGVSEATKDLAPINVTNVTNVIYSNNDGGIDHTATDVDGTIYAKFTIPANGGKWIDGLLGIKSNAPFSSIIKMNITLLVRDRDGRSNGMWINSEGIATVARNNAIGNRIAVWNDDNAENTFLMIVR